MRVKSEERSFAALRMTAQGRDQTEGTRINNGSLVAASAVALPSSQHSE
jgi:hypothetical protein